MAERTPGNIGSIFSRGHRAEACHAEINAGQLATNVRNDGPQPTKTTALLAPNDDLPTGSQDSWAR
eukprot:7730634-Pyramimonas_sp.AAC.1